VHSSGRGISVGTVPARRNSGLQLHLRIGAKLHAKLQAIYHANLHAKLFTTIKKHAAKFTVLTKLTVFGNGPLISRAAFKSHPNELGAAKK
jgi:hypothetical protein